MKLSKRLTTIFDLIPHNAILVDVGTDHGLLIIYALEMKKIKQAFALDIAKQPLEAARLNVNRFGYQEMVNLQLRDGLQGFEDEADCYVVAGMGAETIWEILEPYSFEETDTIIVQSNTKLPWLRKQLLTHGFKIKEERFLVEREIPTFILVVSKVSTPLEFDAIDLWVGPCLRNAHNDVYREYLTNRLKHIQKFVSVNPIHQDEVNALMNYL